MHLDNFNVPVIAQLRGGPLDQRSQHVDTQRSVASLEYGDLSGRLINCCVMRIFQSGRADDDGLAISLLGQAATDADNPASLRKGLPLRLLDRMTERLDGTMSITELDARPNIRIVCTM